MSRQIVGQLLPNERGLYECPRPDCPEEHTTALAAALCCDDRAYQRDRD